MRKYNANILPSSFDNFFKTDHGTRYMIMAQGNKFQKIFIINVLEQTTVKNVAICTACCMGLYF